MPKVNRSEKYSNSIGFSLALLSSIKALKLYTPMSVNGPGFLILGLNGTKDYKGKNPTRCSKIMTKRLNRSGKYVKSSKILQIERSITSKTKL